MAQFAKKPLFGGAASILMGEDKKRYILAVCFIAGMFLCALAGSFASRTEGIVVERSWEPEAAESAAEESAGIAEVTSAEAAGIIVDIDGAVLTPGVYELAAESRLQDAISAAGGLSEGADVAAVNRASILVDAQKIHIPFEREAVVETQIDSGSLDSASQAGGLVNINTASLDELQALSGVGPATAQAIIDERTQNGLFASTEDIMRVSGIGEKKFAKIQGSICV